MSAHPLRTITSLKAIPSYKPLPRRNVEQVSAPWLQPQITTNTTTSDSTTISPSTITTQPTITTKLSVPTITLHSTSQLTYINDIDDTIDPDEFCNPFANTNGNVLSLLDDEYDELDEEDELAQALRQIQQERQREEQTKLKQENHQVQIKHEIDAKLVSNPLLAAKMTQLVREEQILKDQILKGELLQDDNTINNHNEQLSTTPNQTKRKKWTNDSVFANTALTLGDDNDVTKRQRINNDTVNSDKHKEFMRQIFK